ncbi:MAG: aldehyde dehydrogenase family protein [Proteobacteria bacterium]|nr:aldehyde dehydrogenase family protein [Pseudomonadota bacterium]
MAQPATANTTDTLDTPPPTFDILSPVSGQVVGSLPHMDRGQVEAVVARCREAQAVWAALSFSQRARMLRDYRDLLVSRKEEIADVVISETGKPRVDVFATELFYICDGIGYWGRNAARLLADRQVSTHLLKTKKAISTYKPRGVIGMITPWNFPLTLTIGEAIPALMAGNGVVIKPASATPLCAELCCRLADEAGLPEGLLATVTGRGGTGDTLIDFVDMVSFTGSVETGRKVQIRCAEQLKPTTMELGGKDPAIVCADANLDRAANGCVWGSMVNLGQVCMSIERVYAHEDIYDEFVDKVVNVVGQIRQGQGEDADVGSIIHPPQRDIVEDQLDKARASGATVLAGGTRPDMEGCWYQPTVLVDVNHDMEIMQEETFGPVIAIQKVKDDAEAIRLANDSRFGLSASVWSRDKEGATNIARRVEAGAVCVNDHMIHMLIPEVPMGGIKESGIGRRNGEEGIRKFCSQQTIVIDRFGTNKEPIWYPAPKVLAGVLRKVLNLLYRSSWKNKLAS